MDMNWANDARCKGMPLSKFLITENETKKERAAKAVCRRCSVRMECLQFAVATESAGIFGGTTETERQLMQTLSPSMFGESSHNDSRPSSDEPQVPSIDRTGHIPTLRLSPLSSEFHL